MASNILAISSLLMMAMTQPVMAASDIDRRLSAIVSGRGDDNGLAGAALAVMVGDKLVYKGAAGCAAFEADGVTCARALKPETSLRVASVSKMAAAMAALELEKEGVLNLDRDVSDYLGWPLRNPHYADTPITARQLMAHTSSVRDPEEYWVAAPRPFRSLFDGDEPPFAAPVEGGPSRAPGDYFTYANLNYGILAAVMERAATTRFDEIVRTRVLAPMNLDAGFNWSGVSEAARRRGATLYRAEKGRWAAQVDDAATLRSSEPVFLRDETVEPASYLNSYKPGFNPTLFSPQGGLRASVVDIALLMQYRRNVEPTWIYDSSLDNGDTEDGFFSAFGLGVQRVSGNDNFLGGEQLLGHSGEAYGLYAGAWRLPANAALGRPKDISFAFAITGMRGAPKNGAHPTFNTVEERLVRLAIAGAASYESKVKRRHPFNEEADALMSVDSALEAARISGKHVIIIMGGNWCHDSKNLAAKLETPAVAKFLAENFEVVWVDVGYLDRHLDVAHRFGVERIYGTPLVLILSANGELLNADSIHSWRTADSRTAAEALAYLRKWAQ